MKVGRFVIDYLLVPLGMPLLTAAYAGYHASTEIEPASYATLREAWPHLQQPTRSAIASAMDSGSGKISRWQYIPLFNAALTDAGGLVMAGSEDTAQSERAKLKAVIALPAGKGRT
ncbi:hypothetical protein [Paraburkholderia phytofirmans]|uniref:Uncharacterized protein n=1 Tax=Paraburkholderia phytofirmans (strain DSM 17436 / LMG 22146 / PsJN) TaxID=398527 RepID=B2TH35_PARPJ|nr:hypothetical protein [Paraburkholderia phytofirmans]ACD21584.1 conserved hypothetical protein [Paraburkholderia phytofirmans PsJN]